ncbi:hypothetical protein FRX31_018768 [Thalictrum thalictroides]|uniref:Uncharacterized protein n=1 Tax=Thalictrum thalictroides TaxID=46969 RepID=A0A7J6W537_THATH|nr:hypothetical protein FRX31_018768 [Thalictrum thalictroides]
MSKYGSFGYEQPLDNVSIPSTPSYVIQGLNVTQPLVDERMGEAGKLILRQRVRASKEMPQNVRNR